MHGSGVDRDFWDRTQKTPARKEKKKDKLDLSKLKTLFFVNTVVIVKNQAIDWEKIFGKHISDQGLASSIYKEPKDDNSREEF